MRGGKTTVQGAVILEARGEYPAIQGNGNYAGDLTVNKYGGTLQAQISAPNSDMAIYWPQNGNLSISDGTFTGDTAIWAKSGNINITGGTFIADGEKADYVAGNNGAAATGDAVVIEFSADPAYEKPEVFITGGKFTSANAQPIAVYGEDIEENFVTGGSFSKMLATNLIPVGMAQEKQADGYWMLAEGIAYVTGTDNSVTYYVSLQAALDAAKAGETVTLVKDIEIDAAQKITKSITLDLNGMTISRKSGAQGTVLNVNDKSVVVKNGSLNSKVSGKGLATVIVANGALELENVEISNTYSGGYALYAQRATSVKLADCTVTGIIRSEASDGKIGKVEIASGTYNTVNCLEKQNDDAVISLTGGTFDYDVEDFCADGYTAVTTDNEKWIVKKYIEVTVEDAAMNLGNTVPEFAYTPDWKLVEENSVEISVEYAITDAEGNTVTEITEIGEYTITATATLSSDEYAVKVVSGTLTVEKAAEVAEIKETGAKFASIRDAYYAAEADQTIVVLENTEMGDLEVKKNLTIDLNGKTITHAGNGYWTFFNIYKATVEVMSSVEGAKLVNGNIAVGVNGIVTVKDIAIECAEHEAVKVLNGGKLTLENVTVTSDVNAVVVENGSELTINGGSYTSINGPAVTFSDNNAANKVSISGGTFTGKDGIAIVEIVTDTVQLTGGTYNQDVNDFCAADYYAANNGDGTWTVVEKFSFYGSQILLQTNMNMQFAFAQSNFADKTGHYVKIERTYGNGNENDVRIIPADQWTTNGDYYVVTYTGMAAKEMTDTLSLTVYNAEDVAISKTWVDSMQAWALRVLSNPASIEKQKIMAADMLYFGTAMQKTHNYAEDNYAHEGMTAEQAAYATSGTLELVDKLADQHGDKLAGSNLITTSELKFYVAIKGMTREMSAKVEYTNHNGKAMSYTVNGSEFGENSGVCYVNVNTLVVADYAQEITVTVYNSDGSVYTVCKDSVEANMARNRDTELAQAVTKFMKSAHAYLHRNDGK